MPLGQHLAVALIRFLYAVATVFCWVGLAYVGLNALPNSTPLWSQVAVFIVSAVVAGLFVRWLGALATRWLMRRG
jgi:hypothetical protein